MSNACTPALTPFQDWSRAAPDTRAALASSHTALWEPSDSRGWSRWLTWIITPVTISILPQRSNFVTVDMLSLHLPFQSRLGDWYHSRGVCQGLRSLGRAPRRRWDSLEGRALVSTAAERSHRRSLCCTLLFLTVSLPKEKMLMNFQ